MGINLRQYIRDLRRHDAESSSYSKFSKKNRVNGFLVEFLDPLTFLISAPEIFIALNGIFSLIGIAFPPLMIAFFALEITVFTGLAIIVGYKYLKESGQANKDIDAIKSAEDNIEKYQTKLNSLDEEIDNLEKKLESNNIRKHCELANIRKEMLEDISIAAALKKLESEKEAGIKKRSVFTKLKNVIKNNFEKPYYNFKKKHPKIVGGVHYALNFAFALLTVTGIISGLGYVFGISAVSLGIVTLGLIPIAATNPVGWAILIGALAVCAGLFIGRRMFFHSPVSKAKTEIPKVKKDVEHKCDLKKQEFKASKQYLKYLQELDSKSETKPEPCCKEYSPVQTFTPIYQQSKQQVSMREQLEAEKQIVNSKILGVSKN